MTLIDEAQASGARLRPACRVVGLDVRTVQRWRHAKGADDMRMGPQSKPANALTPAERSEVLRVVNSPEYRDLPPKQIVPKLADTGRYLASESTMGRILKAEGQATHRGPKKCKQTSKPREKQASGPCQIWSWDITYLRSPVAGNFFYLYMAMDVWSRKIVGHGVFERECSSLADDFLSEAMERNGAPRSLVLHQDNGSPMKGNLKVKMEHLGITMSYSRPRVSDDNPYSESLFATMKTRPAYPSRAFASLEQARAWVDEFVRWYNETHCHSSIGYVTPSQRHAGDDAAILAKRRQVYAQARSRNPQRWARHARAWTAPEIVYLNPDPATLERMRN